MSLVSIDTSSLGLARRRLRKILHYPGTPIKDIPVVSDDQASSAPISFQPLPRSRYPTRSTGLPNPVMPYHRQISDISIANGGAEGLTRTVSASEVAPQRMRKQKRYPRRRVHRGTPRLFGQVLTGKTLLNWKALRKRIGFR